MKKHKKKPVARVTVPVAPFISGEKHYAIYVNKGELKGLLDAQPDKMPTKGPGKLMAFPYDDAQSGGFNGGYGSAAPQGNTSGGINSTSVGSSGYSGGGVSVGGGLGSARQQGGGGNTSGGLNSRSVGTSGYSGGGASVNAGGLGGSGQGGGRNPIGGTRQTAGQFGGAPGTPRNASPSAGMHTSLGLNQQAERVAAERAMEQGITDKANNYGRNVFDTSRKSNFRGSIMGMPSSTNVIDQRGDTSLSDFFDGMNGIPALSGAYPSFSVNRAPGGSEFSKNQTSPYPKDQSSLSPTISRNPYETSRASIGLNIPSQQRTGYQGYPGRGFTSPSLDFAGSGQMQGVPQMAANASYQQPSPFVGGIAGTNAIPGIHASLDAEFAGRPRSVAAQGTGQARLGSVGRQMAPTMAFGQAEIQPELPNEMARNPYEQRSQQPNLEGLLAGSQYDMQRGQIPNAAKQANMQPNAQRPVQTGPNSSEMGVTGFRNPDRSFAGIPDSGFPQQQSQQPYQVSGPPGRAPISLPGQPQPAATQQTQNQPSQPGRTWADVANDAYTNSGARETVERLSNLTSVPPGQGFDRMAGMTGSGSNAGQHLAGLLDGGGVTQRPGPGKGGQQMTPEEMYDWTITMMGRPGVVPGLLG